MSYALQLEELERFVLSERQVAATLMASPYYQVDGPLPTYGEAVEEFDAGLLEPFVRAVESGDQGFRRAIGLPVAS